MRERKARSNLVLKDSETCDRGGLAGFVPVLLFEESLRAGRMKKRMKRFKNRRTTSTAAILCMAALLFAVLLAGCSVQKETEASGDQQQETWSEEMENSTALSEEPDEIQKKVFSMFTDPTHIKVSDPGKLEGNTVFTYLDAFCRPEYFAEFLPDYANLQELKDHYTRGGLGDMKVKRFLNNVLQAELEPIRNRRKEYQKDIPYVYEILKKGSEKAEAVAEKTLQEVKASMKINYFNDQELIAAQAEKFREE